MALWQKEKLLVLSNFFFCPHVFKRLSAAEASICGKGFKHNKMMKTLLEKQIFLISRPDASVADFTLRMATICFMLQFI